MAEAKLRLLGTESFCCCCFLQSVLEGFQKRFSIFNMTDNHFSKVHHTLLNVMVFMNFVFTSVVCEPFVQFSI